MNARNFAENGDPEPSGRWGVLPSETRSGSHAGSTPFPEEHPEPLAWIPTLPLRTRLVRSMATPAAVGVAVFIIALLVTVYLMVRGLAAEASAPSGPGSLAAEPDTTSEARGGSVQTILVHVVGEVARPGVVELEPGARVRDAIEAAGGATDAAELSGVNLARAVIDGEQVVVPDAETAQAQRLAEQSGTRGGGVIDLNRATAEQLEQLPRVGPALAQRIVEWRTAHGRFSNVDELLEVSGIGAKTLEGFRERVTV